MYTSRGYTLGLDTIAGARLLQQKFGSAGVFQPDQAVLHGDRRARFIRITDGAALIRHWGESEPVAVPPETLSFPPAAQNEPVFRTPASPTVRRAEAMPNRAQPVVRVELGRRPRHHLQRPRLLRA